MNQWKMAGMMVLSLNAFTLTACSKNSQFLNSMNLSVEELNNTSYVNLSAEIDMGNIALDSLQIPVYDPHTQMEIGQIALGVGANGKEQISLKLNASSMLNGDKALGAILPNGRPLPSSLGVAAGEVFAIPALNYSRVYIGGDLKKSIFVGVALAVQALDHVTGSIGLNANIFFSQIFNPNLSGVAGIYASGSAHQNGIAVFGKYTAPSAPVSLPIPVMPTQGLVAKSQARAAQTSESSAVQSVSVSGVTPLQAGNTVLNDNMSTKGEERLYKYFYGKKRVVRPH